MALDASTALDEIAVALTRHAQDTPLRTEIAQILKSAGWEVGGFYEPWTTSPASFATKAEAEEDARAWAQAEELEFIP